jgi:hypothetical protein
MIRTASKSNGVMCLEGEVDELMKGAGQFHRMTGVMHREVA